MEHKTSHTRNPYIQKRKRSINDSVALNGSGNVTGSIKTNTAPSTTTIATDNIQRITSRSITKNNNRSAYRYMDSGPKLTHNDTNTFTVPSKKLNLSDLVVSASDKAGMDGIDRDAIDAIIERESGNSLFMQQQKKRDEKVNLRIAIMKNKLLQKQSRLSVNHDTWRAVLERQVDVEMVETIRTRPVRSCKVVVDMDMFYMACELLSRPDITATTPACVGGTSMITTSNYAARRYGVRAAMPGYIGSALVHQLSMGREQLIFCPLNFDLYKEKSVQIRHVLGEYDPNLSVYSLDEAYVDLAPYLCCSFIYPLWSHEDITAYLNQTTESTPTKVNVDDDRSKTNTKSKRANCSLEDCYDQLLQYSPMECISRIELILMEMRERVRSVTGGLTCSAGCGPNFLLAKIASDINKPNGQCIVRSDHESIVQFLYPLPIRKVSGIGRVTEKILRAFDIVTIQQLYNERALIRFLFDRNPSTGNFLIRASVGCGSSDSITTPCDDDSTDPIIASNQQKGMSRERTIPSGKTWTEINSKLEDIATLLSEDLQKKELSANTINVKVKLHTFDLLSHGRTLPIGVYIRTASDILQVATELLHEIRQKEVEAKRRKSDDNMYNAVPLFSVRLVGIRCTNFKPPQQSTVGKPTTGSSSSTKKILGDSSVQKTIDQFLMAPTMTTRIKESTNRGKESREIFVPFVPYSSKNVKTDDAVYNNPCTTTCAMTPVQARLLSSDEEAVVVGISTTDTCNSVVSGYSDKNSSAMVAPNSSIINSNGDTSKSNDSDIFVCCPICNVRIFNHQHAKIDVLNRHIDTCLNGNTIQQVIREMNEEPRTTMTTSRNWMEQHFIKKSKNKSNVIHIK